ncbi:zinc finger protein 721-like [Cydia pomonella]|uniref:zinc finger protein 721-like n=1 Tax=Cydia pomonella TaxID=82600 RepID=UPI002ADD4403|nr:zinc finger protein 721-like [Cydia pomonella]XP_061724501.1 zinc finger protein 721-like [Cydia pomonella]
MEGGGSTSLEAPRVKEEPEYVVDTCIKIEAEVDEEPEALKPEPACVQLELECAKQETLRKEADLYVDHEVKHDLVLGPEVLQELCAVKRPEASPGPGPASAAGPQRGTHTDLQQSVAVDTYMCDLCDQLFKKKHSLIRHVKAHQRADPEMLPRHSSKKVFYCDICQKQFFQSGHFNRHIRTHTGTKPHVCNICKKEFVRMDCLEIHKRIHTGQKPYSCKFCEKKFTQRHNLTRHVRIHTGEKPYVCDICSKRCTQSGDLKTHKQSHGIDEKYACHLCNKRFKWKSTLNKHRRSHVRKNARDKSEKA